MFEVRFRGKTAKNKPPKNKTTMIRSEKKWTMMNPSDIE
jgi:hypothetical protein